MPLLLSVLQNAQGSEYHKLRLKDMGCAGLIGEFCLFPFIVLPPQGFDQQLPSAEIRSGMILASCANSSCKFKVSCLPSRCKNEGVNSSRIDSPIEPDDTLLSSYLVASWAKICQALGPEFEPYLPVVMPPLLRAASAKADVSVIGSSPDESWGLYAYCFSDEEDERFESDAWTTIKLEGQSVGIKSAVLEEKCQALEMLLVYVSTLGGSFAPYLTQSFELVLPALRFYFHVGVQETATL